MSEGPKKLKAVSWKRNIDGVTEKDFLWALALDAEFRTEHGGRDLMKMAGVLNDHFHNGETIRTPVTVTRTLSLYKRFLPEEEAGKEDLLRKQMSEGYVAAPSWTSPVTSPVSDITEEAFLWNLVLDEDYRLEDGGRDLPKMTERVNDVYHGGEPIRTAEAARHRLSLFKRLLPERSSAREDDLLEKLNRYSWNKVNEDGLTESEFVWKLASNLEYAAKNGMDLDKIADEVNREYHGGEPVRTPIAVSVKVSEFMNSQPDYVKRRPWSSVEESAVMELASNPEYRTSREIAGQINEDYHGGEPVRTPIAVRGKMNEVRNSQPDYVNKSLWSSAEESAVMELASNPEYRTSRGVDLDKIAGQINEDYHGGEPVRTPIAVRRKMNKVRNSQPDYKKRRHVWSSAEESAVMELASNPEYRTSSGVDLDKIAGQINEDYHGGEPVRTPIAVRSKMDEVRNSQPDYVNKSLWSSAEESAVMELASNPEYRTSRGVDLDKIAGQINEDYHGGEFVRTPTSVKLKISKIRRSQPDYVNKRPWSSAEESAVMELASNPEYRTSRGVDADKIAGQINEDYHGGEFVRTPTSVEGKISKIRRSQPDYKAREEAQLLEDRVEQSLTV